MEIDRIINLLQGMPLEMQVIILSMLPIAELRLSIPYALVMGLSPVKAFIYGVCGNWLPLIPILLFLKPLVRLAKKFSLINTILTWLVTRTRKKSYYIHKYGYLGLIFFVGIPLPGTGAWTGAFLAFFLGISFWHSVLGNTIGIILAGLIVTVSFTGIKLVLLNFITNLWILLILILILFLVIILKR